MKAQLIKLGVLCFAVAMSLGVASCGSDNEEEVLTPSDQENEQKDDTPSSDKGKDNTKDLIVTGGIEKITMDMNASFTAEVIGYVNLTDSMKLLYGGLMEFGIEMSADPSFPEDARIYPGMPIVYTNRKTGKLKEDRKFSITFDGLVAEKTYYYRSYIQTGNNLPIYGATEKFTTSDVETMIKKQKMVIPRGTVDYDYYGNVYFSVAGSGVACATDKSLLTSANVKKGVSELTTTNTSSYSSYYYTYKNGKASNGLIIGFVESGSVRGLPLEAGTYYYYVEFKTIGNTVILSEVGQFKTKGYKKKDLTAHIVTTATPNYVKQVWNVQLKLSLSSLGINREEQDVSLYLLSSMTSTRSDIDTVACKICGQEVVTDLDGTFKFELPFAIPDNTLYVSQAPISGNDGGYVPDKEVYLTDLSICLELWKMMLDGTIGWWQIDDFRTYITDRTGEFSKTISTYGLKYKFSTTLTVDGKSQDIDYITADIHLPTLSDFHFDE